ncbi:MAG TPA: cytochrome oxidase subunit III [Deltaproteobacteria bacterium]|nr:cytochrome oxidase subunit III [Deltaproteobacteria bacterium]
MPETKTAHAEQFDSLPQQRETATLGMWTFLVTEVLFFGGLFLSFLVYRHAYPQAFAEASRHLSVALGGLNTGVLLTSSLTMVLACQAAEQRRRKALAGFLLLTVLLGAAFLAIKLVEYSIDYREHLIPGKNFRADGEFPEGQEMFFYLYFFMTGLHALHLIIGIVVVSIIAALAWRGRYEKYSATVENTGLYWHFVDIVWIFLFPLLYLMERSP